MASLHKRLVSKYVWDFIHDSRVDGNSIHEIPIAPEEMLASSGRASLQKEQRYSLPVIRVGQAMAGHAMTTRQPVKSGK
jgi:hypothetical protein